MLGSGAAAYLRFVGATNRLTYEGAFDYEAFDVRTPLIITMWHGQHFLLPIVRRRDHRIYALISRHRDGEINAIAARKLGVETIRGSAAREPGRVMGSGAVSGYLRMRAVLSEGASVSMTADLSRTVARRAGIGVVHLARASGVPIATAAIATSRRLGIRSWDRASLNLPFGRMALVIGAFIDVPPDADDALMEEKRLAVENELNRITDRAYAIVDRRNA
ncbi:MAG: lysophospholipid acyltransferase family protein [Bauldia sp.]|nr:lysophospholipid acyltransferase family protein [Bauldia sp.]